MKTLLPNSIRSWLAAGSALFSVSILAPAMAHACEACNAAFTEQIMNERADTPGGRDMLRAMENQRGLPLEGMGSESFLASSGRSHTPASPSSGTEAGGTRGNVTSVETQEAGVESEREEATLMVSPEAAAAPGPREAFTTAAPATEIAGPVPMGRPLPTFFEGHEFIEIIERDHSLQTPPTSYVPQDAPVDKEFTIRLHEGSTYLGNGVVYDGFLTNGKIPGPTLVVDQDDIVRFNVINEGRIPHGASIHAANTQTSKYVGKIGPGEERSVVFKATQPGIYMYHCAPGGHAIPMHVMFGQYGMIVVRPKEQYQLEKELGHGPDLELFIVQHELYASGKDAVEGNAAYAMFNGKLFRYVEDPIMVKPGDYVRINFLNVGPNLLSTFHIVGIIWDYVYWQGHPKAMLPAGQTVTAGPSDSWVIEFRMPPDEGAYTILSHAVGSASRGAIGLLVVDPEAETEPIVLAEGPDYTEAEMEDYVRNAQRVISPFRPGTHPADTPVVYGPETKEVHVSIIGNSYWPKVIQVAPGTTVTWTNEDVFTFMAGEYAGIHNVMGTSAPPDSDGLISPLLAHGESFSYTFEEEWEYEYICTPHPYMLAKVIVAAPDYDLSKAGGTTAAVGGWVLPLVGVTFLLSTIALVGAARRRAP